MALALSGIIFAGNYLFYSQLIKYRDRADTRLGKLLADRELPVLYRAREIIEPFAQEKQDARSVYQGTGLGMSIVKCLNREETPYRPWSRGYSGSRWKTGSQDICR